MARNDAHGETDRLAALPTEAPNPDTDGLDLLPTADLVDRLLLVQQRAVGDAANRARPAIARAVDATVAVLRRGGRLVYAGTGTSGLLADTDAAELPPTFGFDHDRLLVLRPGAAGVDATEDAVEAARDAVDRYDLGGDDVVVALAASGRTPLVVAVAEAARTRGALTVGVANNPNSPLAAACDLSVELLTGPEPIAGSTRMSAGLAQKLFLATFSTSVMVALGMNYSNHMTRTTSALSKLTARRQRTVQTLADVDADAAGTLLRAAQGDVEVAVVMARCGVEAPAAIELLARHDSLREVLERCG
ncbi:MAG: N-acetylmuramic acid 6-phosphate etherase [Microthrixaceae bacterium]